MKGKSCFFIMIMLVLVIIMLWTPMANSTNGMKVIGVGPVQRSMGGTSVGLPLDSATTITNPAGMTEIGKRVDFGVTYFAPDVSYKANSSLGQVTNNGRTISSDANPSIIPAFGIVIPINDNITFGLGAYGVCGMGVDYKKNLYNNITYTKYTFMKFAPAIAYSVNNKLSIGLAPNIDYATMDYEAGTTAEAAHHGGTAYGFGFTVGTLYKATDFLSFGLAYESKQRFSDFEFNTTKGRDELDFDQPQSITAGMGIKPSDKFRIAFDVSWIDWPQSNGKDMPAYTKNSSNATAWNMNWDEQFVYKLGVEYEPNEKITLRGGYNYGKNPLDSKRPFENISFPAIAEHHITGGVGIKLSEKLELNFGFMYAPKVSFDTANAGAQFIDSATTEMSQYSIDVGISYKF